jgi:hypothetical protein
MNKVYPLGLKGVNVWFKHIRTIWVLELKFFGHCSNVFALQITLESFKWYTHNYLNHSKQIGNEEDVEFDSNGGLMCFFLLEWTHPLFASFLLLFWVKTSMKYCKPSINTPMATKIFQEEQKNREIW